MAPRETEDNAYAKFWGDKQRALWYVMVFSITYSPFWKREGNWNRNASRNCFWVLYLGRTDQQLAKRAIPTITSFYYYDQNPSGFCFLVQIRAFVFETSLGILN